MKSNAYLNLSKEYDAVAKETKAILDDLQGSYEETVSMNALYQKKQKGVLAKKIFEIILLIAIFVFLDEIHIGYGMIFSQEISDNLKEVTLISVIALLIYEIDAIFRYSYSRSIEEYQKRITKMKTDVQERIDKMQQEYFYQHTLTKLRQGETIVQKHSNQLGEKISLLRKEMQHSARESIKMDKFFRISVAVILYLLGFGIFLLHSDECMKFSENSLFWVGALGIYYTFAMDFILIKAGQYLGKWMRPFGGLLVLGYGAFLWWMACRNYDSQAITLEGMPEEIQPFLTTGNIILILQILGMLISVIFANYLGMKMKWEGESFQLVMAYGKPKTKERDSVAFRSALLIIFFMATCKIFDFTLKQDILFYLPLMWWVTIPLMKPFGSTLYQYFGRAKCIGISFTLLGILIGCYIEKVEILGLEECMILLEAFGIYLLIGGFVVILNLFTPIFFFLNPFI